LSVKIILLGDYSVGKSSLLRVLARYSDYTDLDNDTGEEITNASIRASFKGNSLPRSGWMGSSSQSKSGSLPGRGTSTPRGTLVRSSLKPGGFVEVEFTHQDRTVLARIADTGGE
jgi:GTPase SAR1 family protein